MFRIFFSRSKLHKNKGKKFYVNSDLSLSDWCCGKVTIETPVSQRIPTYPNR